MIVIFPEWCLDHHQHEPELEKTKQVTTLRLSLYSKFEEKKSTIGQIALPSPGIAPGPAG